MICALTPRARFSSWSIFRGRDRSSYEGRPAKSSASRPRKQPTALSLRLPAITHLESPPLPVTAELTLRFFVSSHVSPEKLPLIQDCGAQIRHSGDNPLEAELAARAVASATGKTYISPYNDPYVIAGQGTIGLGVGQQVDSIDAIYIAVGGGGLISGIGAYMKSVTPQTEIVGCWPENSRVMYECLRVGRVIYFPEQPTLSESTAGGVEPESITLELCQRVIDRGVLVSELEILDAMRWAYQRGWKIEGAAGVL